LFLNLFDQPALHHFTERTFHIGYDTAANFLESRPDVVNDLLAGGGLRNLRPNRRGRLVEYGELIGLGVEQNDPVLERCSLNSWNLLVTPVSRSHHARTTPPLQRPARDGGAALL